MRDFKRIGGEILSSPLNENFRKLRNDISIANSNLVFSDKYGIMATVKDMEDLIDNLEVELVEGQACYVVSSGELYRFSELDDKWHKIADFGQTFRQSFLNSGAVLVEAPIGVSTDYLLMPRMLVYFKNKPGEDPYLKGMYLIEAQDVDVHPGSLNTNIMYSIYVDYTKTYHIVEGIPAEDDPNNIFIGSFMLHNRALVQELVYTMPDIAYTADRGSFLINGGQCSGAELYVAPNSHYISRKFGYYYDEGINYPGSPYYSYSFNQLENTTYTIQIDGTSIGYFNVNTATEVLGEIEYYPEHPDRVLIRQNDLIVATYPVSVGESGEVLAFVLQNSIDNYPKSLDDTSNYNLKALEAIGTVNNFYYTTPKNSIENLELNVNHIVYNKYMPKESDELVNVTTGCFTIQKHLITPTGQNIMVYGDTEYESYEDAESHLNDSVELDGEFLYAEVTRVIVENPEDTFDPAEHCTFFTTNRLTQVGTVSPIFADNEFKLYSHEDVSPTFLSIDLARVRNELVKDYILQPYEYEYTQYNFALNGQYISGSAGNTDVDPITASQTAYHNIDANNKGYIIPSKAQLETLRSRVNDVETEIWNDYQNGALRYNQSIRYRLYKLENDIYNDYNDQVNSLNINPRLTTAEANIDYAEYHKANKETLINGYALGDATNKYPSSPYTINLVTGDIAEGLGHGSVTNLWFTDERVSQNQDVMDSVAHKNTISANDSALTHTRVNPHNLSTDDINLLQNTNKLFVTQDEERRIRADKLPDDTIAALAGKLENLDMYSIDADTQGETHLGGITTLKVSSDVATVTVNNGVGILEYPSDLGTIMYRSVYTPIADHTAGKAGFVDKALYADTINTTGAGPSQYYGTDANYGTTSVGWKDLPVYVSTSTAEYPTVNIDSVLLRPEDRSVALKHLANSRVVYTPADEETDLGDNVYNLVKNHYHQVYNSGTQGPYIEDPNHPGTYIQDTSGIIYTYKVPYGGMIEHAYYFEYNNINYTFNTTNLGTIAVNTVLTYIPSSGNIEVTISGTTRTLTTSQVQPTAVDDDYFITFVAQTDWSKINKWNFGDNLTVTVANGIATVNAFNASSDSPVHSFVNLDDVDFVYEDAQPGQMIVINDDATGVMLSDAPSMSSYMLISDFVNAQQPTKVNAAVTADSATTANSATTAGLLQGTYTVNNNNTDNTSLWTSSKISTTISNKIATESVRTDYGTDLPSAHTFSFTPKRGDLYILTE